MVSLPSRTIEVVARRVRARDRAVASARTGCRRDDVRLAPLLAVAEHDLVDLVLGSTIGVVEVRQLDAVAIGGSTRGQVVAASRQRCQIGAVQIGELNHIHPPSRAVRLVDDVLAEAAAEHVGIAARTARRGCRCPHLRSACRCRAPPLSVSLPSPPSSRSARLPPVMMSLPARPLRLLLARLEPVTVSAS